MYIKMKSWLILFIQYYVNHYWDDLQGTLAITKYDIYNEANGHVGSTKWIKNDTYKCNIFVDDVLANVDATRPRR